MSNGFIMHARIDSAQTRSAAINQGGVNWGPVTLYFFLIPLKRGVRVGKPPDAPIQVSSHFVNSC